MSALPNRFENPVQSGVSSTRGAANAWLLRHHHEIASRANAVFAHLDPDRREEATAEVTANAVAWAHSAARRGRLHRVTPYWFVVYASRQYRQGRRFTGSNCRCAMSEAAKIKHGIRVASLDDESDTGDFHPRRLRESLADRDAENPFDVARRAIDFAAIFALESVSAKAIATFEFLASTKSEGKQCDLAVELRVTGGRITQLKAELAEALARHDYVGPLGRRSSTKVASGDSTQVDAQRI